MCFEAFVIAAATAALSNNDCDRDNRRRCRHNRRFIDPEMTIHRNAGCCREERPRCNPCRS